MYEDLNAWLAQVKEAPIEPDLPILDPHPHLWDRHRFWKRINQRYSLDEFLADLDCGYSIVQTVFVECSTMYRQDGPKAQRPVGETEYLTSLAEEGDRRKTKTKVVTGITGWADLLLGEAVTPVLEAHVAAAKGRFRGIRGHAALDPHPQIGFVKPPAKLLADPTYRKGIAALGKWTSFSNAGCTTTRFTSWRTWRRPFRTCALS